MRILVTNGLQRAAAALLALAGAVMMMSSPVLAQSSSEPTPYRTLDEFGVDVSTGTFNFSMVDVAGNPGSTSLSYARTWTQAGWKDDYSGHLYQASSSSIVVVHGGVSESFTKSGSTWVPAKANGATLVQTTTGTGSVITITYTHTTADGTVTVYKAMGLEAVAPDDSFPVLYTLYGLKGGCKITTPANRKLSTERCAVPISITAPGRDEITLGWPESSTSCTYNGGVTNHGWNCEVKYWQTGISDDSGYSLHISSSKVTLVNRAVDSCIPSCSSDWPTATYSTPVSGTEQVIDSKGGTWTFTFDSSYRMTSIKRPGDASASTTITYYTSGKVASVTKDGVTRNYSWSTSGGADVVDISGGPSGGGTVTSDPAKGQPGTIVNAASKTTTNIYDSKGRITRTTEPEGNYVNYTYDCRGNVTETRMVAKPGSGLADIVTTASYDTTCSSAVKCNQPNYVIDPLGNRTDYTYSTTHGGVTRVRLPSPAAEAPGTETGTRPEINYSDVMAWTAPAPA